MARIINKKTGAVLVEKNSEKQELWCHECESYVQFPIDLSMDGNHVLNCPKCDHEHCRVVENGRITSTRWDSRNKTHNIASYTLASSGTCITASTYMTGWGITSTTSTSANVWFG